MRQYPSLSAPISGEECLAEAFPSGGEKTVTTAQRHERYGVAEEEHARDVAYIQAGTQAILATAARLAEMAVAETDTLNVSLAGDSGGQDEESVAEEVMLRTTQRSPDRFAPGISSTARAAATLAVAR